MGKQIKKKGPSAVPSKSKRQEMRAEGREVVPAYGSSGVPAKRRGQQ